MFLRPPLKEEKQPVCEHLCKGVKMFDWFEHKYLSILFNFFFFKNGFFRRQKKQCKGEICEKPHYACKCLLIMYGACKDTTIAKVKI